MNERSPLRYSLVIVVCISKGEHGVMQRTSHSQPAYIVMLEQKSIEIAGNPDSRAVLGSPQRPDDVLKPGQLKGAREMHALMHKLQCLGLRG